MKSGVIANGSWLPKPVESSKCLCQERPRIVSRPSSSSDHADIWVDSIVPVQHSMSAYHKSTCGLIDVSSVKYGKKHPHALEVVLFSCVLQVVHSLTCGAALAVLGLMASCVRCVPDMS
eukprot:3358157-Amphidinium_carterae.1